MARLGVLCGSVQQDDIGGAGGDIQVGLGQAGQHQHRRILRRARDVQRPAHGEKFAFVVEQVHFFGIVEAAAGLVEQQRAGIPALPQALNDADVFLRAAAEHIVGKSIRPAEIGGFPWRLRHGRVPAGAAMADDVERSKTARQIVRLVSHRRGCSDKADPTCHRRHRRQQGRRFERTRPGAVRRGIIEDNHVQPRRFRLLGKAGQVAEPERLPGSNVERNGKMHCGLLVSRHGTIDHRAAYANLRSPACKTTLATGPTAPHLPASKSLISRWQRSAMKSSNSRTFGSCSFLCG